MPELFTVDPREVEIPERVIAARLGFKGVGKIPDEFKSYFERAYSEVLKYASPKALHDTYDCKYEGNKILVGNYIIRSNLVREHLKRCKKITLIASTLGHKIDERIRKESEEGDILLSFFIDGISSELVEYFTRLLDKKLREENGTGSARLSPGYGDFDISYNKLIIDLLGAHEIEVSYDPETFIMTPRKTITAIIGWMG